MAKSSKKKADQTKAKVTEAEAVAPTEEVVAGDDTIVDAEVVDEAVAEQVEEDAAETIDSDLAMDVVEEEAPAEEEIAQDEDVQRDAPPRTEPQKSGAGFFPMLLGGVAAGAIGFGIGQHDPSGNTDFQSLISEQSARVDALGEQVAGLGDIPDLAPLTDRIDEFENSLTSRMSEMGSELQETLGTVDARLTELEKRPNADGTLSDAALSAYQTELEGLRAALDAQKEEVTSLAAQAQADLEAARAEAAEVEQRAIATAQAAAARAAINRVAAAVDTGADFGAVLNDPSLSGIDIPVALTETAETGVPTRAQLATAFPEAARAALAAARSEGQSDDAAGLGGFLRNQFDVRSTTPQEGPGPDAVLSRAEAAIKDGRVADALAEIEALPEVARAAMTDWTAQAQSRSDALAAIATLSETLNSN